LDRVNIKRSAKFALILLFGVCSALMAQGRILHSPSDRATAGRPKQVFCQLEGVVSPVRLIRVYYRLAEEQEYKFVTMVPSGTQWKGTIPAIDIVGQRLQYFIVCSLQDDKLLSYPWKNAKSDPEEVTIFSGSVKTTPSPSSILILSPEADQILEPRTAFLAISLSRPSGSLDAASVKIFLDGRDVTRHAIISEFVATLDMKMLAEGKHEVDVHARDVSGADLIPASFMFFVKGPRKAAKKKSHFNGRVFAEGRREQVFKSDQSFAMGGADFSGTYGSIDVQGRLFLTSLEEAGAQPRDRFFLSIGNDHFTMQAGDVYPRYNDLIMWGKRVRGVSAAVQAGPVKMEAIFGETYRSVEGIGTTGATATISRYGTYQQQLLGVRPSLNFDDNVKAGLTIVKIKDDIGSIQFGANPNDNLILGPDLLLSFDKKRIELRAQAAYSLFTRDAGLGAFSKFDIENIFGSSVNVPINPGNYSSILIINDTTVPLDPREFTSAAYDVNFKLHYFRNLLRFGYKSIGSDYYSLANSWLRKDIRGFYLSDRVRLFRNKIYATFSMERFKNNLAEEGTKPVSDLNSLNFALSYYPGRKWPSINIAVRDFHRTNGITDVKIDSLLIIGELDTLDAREDSRHRDLSLQLGYQLSFLDAEHYFTASYISAIKDDRYKNSRLLGYFPQELTSDIKMLAWTTTYQAPMRTTFSFSTNSNVLANGLSDFQYNSISGFGEYRFFNEKLTSFAEMRLLSSTGMSFTDQPLDVQRFHVRLGGSYHFKFRQTVLLEAMMISLDSKSTDAPASSSYTDYLIRMRYEKLF
jgi:hypothetical protein